MTDTIDRPEADDDHVLDRRHALVIEQGRTAVRDGGRSGERRWPKAAAAAAADDATFELVQRGLE